MNERAVRLLVGLLERWVEDVQEELHRAQHLMLLSSASQQMQRLHLTAPIEVRGAPTEEKAAVGAAAAGEEIPITKKTADHGRTASAAGSIEDEDTETTREPIEVAA